MTKRALYLPLFAKAQLVLVVPALVVVLLVLYPQRKKEAAAYARSPVCAEGATDLGACRRMAIAEVVRSKCSSELNGVESCDLGLRVDGQPAFIELLPTPTARFTPGSKLRVEMMAGVPTAAEVNGQLIRDYGSPEKAMAMIRLIVLSQILLTFAAALYLGWQRRQAATSAPVG